MTKHFKFTGRLDGDIDLIADHGTDGRPFRAISYGMLKDFGVNVAEIDDTMTLEVMFKHGHYAHFYESIGIYWLDADDVYKLKVLEVIKFVEGS